MKPIGIRAATANDASAIGALHVASWREAYSGMLPDALLAEASVESRTAMWSGILGAPDSHRGIAIFVAEEDGRPIGFGACGGQRDEALSRAGFGGEIGAVYVLRSHQGRGAGRSIMSALARALRESGHDSATLWVLRENSRARGFYEMLGGEMMGEKSSEQAGGTIVEVAYGWRDLSRLTGKAAAP